MDIYTYIRWKAPSGPPVDIKCSSMGSQSLSLSWQPPSMSQQNGVIQGYRIYYENMNEWPPGTASVEAAVRDAHDSMLILEDLQKFGNYSIQVWAYTLAGDGVKSHAIYCLTDEDVPEPPAEVKVVLKSISSLIVSWRPPNKHNGRIIGYNVYSRVVIENREKDSSKRKVLVPNQHLEIHDLRLEENYEYWVTAFNRAGEGQSTSVVFTTMTSRVAAGIVSFGESLWVQRGHSIRLSCIIVGLPTPERAWHPLSGGSRLLDDGTLVIEQMQKQHQDNYTCTASNINGISSIIYSLHILGPPSAPNPQVIGTGSTWLEISWRQVEHGGSPVRGFILAYRPSIYDVEGVTNESNDHSSEENKNKGQWNELALPRDKFQHRLEGLSCGRAYQFHLVAYNKVGSSAPGAPLLAQTNGGKPLRPHISHLLEPGPTNITVHLRAWNDNGCPPLLGFDIQYREMGHKEFLAAGTGVQGRHSYTILGLWPSTDYEIRITALNAAGLTNALYSLSTLPLQTKSGESRESGEKFVPINSSSNESSFFNGVGIIISFMVLSLIIVGSSLGICICWRKRVNAAAEHQQASNSFGDAQAMVSLDNKQNLAQREQYYAALEKNLPTGKCEKVPEFADDISPYATFHVSNQPSDSTVSSAQVHTFVYHEQRVAAMETMQLKSVNPRSSEEYSKLRLSTKSKGDYSSGGPVRRDSSTSSRRNPLSSQSMLYAGPGVMTTQLPVDSSTSPEASPVPERRNPPAHRHRYAR